MQTIMIIDDEPVVREGLEVLIDWPGLDCQIIATADNGAAGLQDILRLKPDIVLTDIKMPYLSGLEMAAEVKKTHPEIEFVLLSGYSEFSYAQEAIKIGTFSYLLKPVEELELIETIEKLVMKIKQRKEVQVTVETYQTMDKRYLLKELIINQKMANSLEPLLKQAPFALIQLPTLETNVEGYRAYLSERGGQGEVLEFSHGSNGYLFLTQVTKPEIDLADDWFWENELEDGVVIISQIRNHTDKLYEDIQANEQKKFLFKERVLTSEKLEIAKKAASKESLSAIQQRLLEELTAATYVEEEWHMASLSHYFQRKQYSETQTKVELSKFTLSLFQELEERMNDPFADELKETILEDMMKSQSLVALLSLLKHEFSRLHQVYLTDVDNQNIVQKMIHFTSKNYGADLNLQFLAMTFNYNSSYLGKKFTSEVGVSYSKYLDQIRIREAKNLLKMSNLMIYEVAEKVGYNNIDYFHKKFKTLTQVSPNEYRKKKNQEVCS